MKNNCVTILENK